MESNERPEFTVDTGLFRQLGELLVGRDSTAIIELVKNAYDADATSLVLEGRNLADPDQAVIRVVDNGTGMTEAQFRSGFLRLAARSKTLGDRRSSLFGRKFTGEKGVGRLAVHKLGAFVEVLTVAEREASLSTEIASSGDRRKTHDQFESALKSVTDASIDWDVIESVESVSAIRDGLELQSSNTSSASALGTLIQISRLRHSWGSEDLADLSEQIDNFSPPEALTAPLGRGVLAHPVLFDRPTVRDSSRDDPGLEIELQGDFYTADHFWPEVQNSADWVLEIRAERGTNVYYSMSPTRIGSQRNEFAEAIKVETAHPSPGDGPFFDARIFLRSGIVSSNERAWANVNSGIRVYLEGFRVLPYGESKNDWLALDLDYTRRGGRFELDPVVGDSTSDLTELRNLKTRDVSLRLQPNRNFFGAVFLTDDGASGLRTLVNREGFVPDASYSRLVQMVRSGTDLLHRSWALASLQKKQDSAAKKLEEARIAEQARAAAQGKFETSLQGDRDDDRENAPHAPDGPGIPEQGDGPDSSDDQVWEESDDTEVAAEAPTEGSGTRLLRELHLLKSQLEGITARASDASFIGELRAMNFTVQALEGSAETLLADASLLRVLASVGSQLSAFTHEIAHLVPVAVDTELALVQKPGERWPQRVSSVRSQVSELRRAIERQAAYLVDVSSSEARRRRSRQNLHERVELAFLAASAAAATIDVQLENRVPEGVKTPPMYRSELQSILANLLSNAVKATENGGRVAVSAEVLDAALRIDVSNTGTPVSIASSERFFVPYVSDSVSIDPVLSQGMGLGLPITRQLVEEYGGTVRFVKPQPGFSTSIAIEIPN